MGPYRYRSGIVGRAAVCVAALSVFAAMPIAPSAAVGSEFGVNSAGDGVDANPGDGECLTALHECTLRAAIQESNALAGRDQVTLYVASVTLVIPGTDEDAAKRGDLDITDDVSISAVDGYHAVVDGGGLDRVFHVIGGDVDVYIADLTITGGRADDSPFVAGILSTGTLSLRRTTVEDNKTPDPVNGVGGIRNDGGVVQIVESAVANNQGAGVRSRGELTMFDSTISDNTGVGVLCTEGFCGISTSYLLNNKLGGIESGYHGPAELDVSFSAIEGNMGSTGGGIRSAGALRVSRSTIAENTAGYSGGGIHLFARSGTATIENSTVSGNTAGVMGGGIWVGDETTLLAKNVTIHDNSAERGGGIYTQTYGNSLLGHTILAGNHGDDGPECRGTVVSREYNLFGDLDSCTLTGPNNHNVYPAEALLAPLTDGGWITRSHTLLRGSPAVDAGDPAEPDSTAWACRQKDQRSVSRPQGPRCDIGAVELSLEERGPFLDDDGSVFEADIEWMATEGITRGCNPPTNDRFCPDSFVTRGQMAAFLVRALDLTDRFDDPFIDDDGSIFESDIERLAAAGITKGCNPPSERSVLPRLESDERPDGSVPRPGTRLLRRWWRGLVRR